LYSGKGVEKKRKLCEKRRKDATGLHAWPYPISNGDGHDGGNGRGRGKWWCGANPSICKEKQGEEEIGAGDSQKIGEDGVRDNG